MRELALFAGAGGGILGSMLLGWSTVCAVEIDPYCRSVLLQRQIDGCIEPFPIWDDIRTFDGGPWRGHVDVITGGFPCQDISAAGRGDGIDGERSSLWFEMARVIREVRPLQVFVENSPMLTVRGINRVLGSLASMGFDARWGVLGAVHAGAPHRRNRIWIMANSSSGRCNLSPARKMEQSRRAEVVGASHAANTYSERRQRGPWEGEEQTRRRQPENGGSWPPEPDVGRVAYGVANRVDRLRALGNGQVPSVAAMAYEILCGQPLGEEVEAFTSDLYAEKTGRNRNDILRRKM